jgi:hypothetical protein
MRMRIPFVPAKVGTQTSHWSVYAWISACAEMSGVSGDAYRFSALSCAMVAARRVVWSLPAIMKR